MRARRIEGASARLAFARWLDVKFFPRARLGDRRDKVLLPLRCKYTRNRALSIRAKARLRGLAGVPGSFRIDRSSQKTPCSEQTRHSLPHCCLTTIESRESYVLEGS